MCPTQVAGTQVVATDTEDGASLAFTTTGDVAEVRARVRRMADHHNQMHGAGGRGGMGGRGMNMPMVPSRASVQDIDGGARIVFTPLDAANLEALRAEARRHAGMMASGECPMRMMGATPPPRAPQ